MEQSALKPEVSWAEIENSIHNLERVDGGFTAAHRGIVTLASGRNVFVKVGIDADTKKWAQQEITMYKFLSRHDFPFAPALLAINQDKSGFAIEALKGDDGWDWSGIASSERLDKTLEAMDALAALTPNDAEKEHIPQRTNFDYEDGWSELLKDVERQSMLLTSLRRSGHRDTAESLDFAKLAARNSQHLPDNNVLVHNDVRGDNCAWNAAQKTVKLVDWNWAGLGDRNIDVNALLVSAQKNGVNIISEFADRLDGDALLWLAGFWLNDSTKPVWPDGPTQLRGFQLQTGVVALNLFNKLSHP